MKNILKAVTATAIAILTLIYHADAQIMTGNTSINDKTGFSTPVINDGEKSSDLSNTINARALKDFQKTFNGVTNAEWSKIEGDGYIAKFTGDNVQTMVAYNLKGIWHHTIRYYDEKKLVHDIRSIVKSSYYDYSILTIAEVHFNDQTVYMIYVQDETHLKTIRVCDGEMQEV